MKKTVFTFFIVLALVFSIGAFSPTGEAHAETAAQPGTGAFSADGSVIFDENGVKVTTAGLDNDPSSDDVQPIIWVEIENTGETDVCLGVSNGSVNGFMCDPLLVVFCEEDGDIYSTDYTFSTVIPALSSGRYALSYYKPGAPGVNADILSELEFCFTLAEDEYSWPDYTSAPVTVVTGEEAADVDLSALGTAVIDDDTLLLVVGEQDYDDFFGPTVYVYTENRSEDWVGIAADTADADGHSCDYIYYYTVVAPGKRSAGWMSFEDGIKELKGIENLTLGFKLSEAATMEELDAQDARMLDPVSVQYPPQNWGEYENGGLELEIKPKYHDLVTVETPADDPYGILFSVSETASVEAGRFEGAGWLFSIGRVSEEKLHEILCYDMSGINVFAKDGDGNYYIYCHPTDVRFERATPEEFESGLKQWSMLCEWAWNVPDRFSDKNGLEYVSFSNSEVDICVARAAWMDDTHATLGTPEDSPVDVAGVDGTPYAEAVMQGWFTETDPAETPDGEYIVLDFPDNEIRVDFFFAPGAYARVVSGGREALYQAAWYDDSVSFAEIMQDWYDAARNA